MNILLLVTRCKDYAVGLGSIQTVQIKYINIKVEYLNFLEEMLHGFKYLLTSQYLHGLTLSPHCF